MDLQQGIQTVPLRFRQTTGQLVRDMAFRAQQRRRHHTLKNGGSGSDNTPAAQFHHQRLRHRHATDRRQGDRQQPVRQRAMIRLAEAAEPEDGLQDVEMIVSGRGTGRIAGEFAGIDIELLPDKPHHLQRHQLTGPDQPAGMAQGAELEGEPETVVGPAAAGDCRHVSWIQRVVADEVGFGGGQGEQRGDLGIGKHAAARHEGLSLLRYKRNGTRILSGIVRVSSRNFAEGSSGTAGGDLLPGFDRRSVVPPAGA